MARIPINQIENIRARYATGLSIADIASEFDVTYGPMYRFFVKHGIQIRSLTEAKKKSNKTMDGLNKWQSIHGSWYRGLTKNDPKVAAIIDKGRLTQIKNGKNKGKHNPMYGKVSHAKGGYREDLGHFVRSTWEANFARILVLLKLQYEYEPKTFTLSDGTTYTPDFFVLSKNKYYEIKGFERNKKHHLFVAEFPQIKLQIVNKRFYNRLMLRFGKKISIDIGSAKLNSEDIKEKFVNYCLTHDCNPSVRQFCLTTHIPRYVIESCYGSYSSFLMTVESQIAEIERNRLISKFQELIQQTNKTPTYKELQRFYPRTATILNKFFEGKFSALIPNTSPNPFDIACEVLPYNVRS